MCVCHSVCVCSLSIAYVSVVKSPIILKFVAHRSLGCRIYENELGGDVADMHARARTCKVRRWHKSGSSGHVFSIFLILFFGTMCTNRFCDSPVNFIAIPPYIDFLGIYESAQINIFGIFWQQLTFPQAGRQDHSLNCVHPSKSYPPTSKPPLIVFVA